MRSNSWIHFSRLTLTVLMLFSAAVVCGQEEDGNAELDKAFDAKLNARTTKDLDEVVKLCETAIEKGLDKEGVTQANQLASSASLEFANQLGKRIFDEKDTRWRIYRSQALNRLRKAIEFDPDMVDAYLLIAKLNGLPGGDKDEALEAIDKVVELADGDKAQLSEALVQRALLTEDEKSLIEDLNEAIETNPENVDAIKRRADYYLRLKEPKASST